jgi:hypothetical protein
MTKRILFSILFMAYVIIGCTFIIPYFYWIITDKNYFIDTDIFDILD